MKLIDMDAIKSVQSKGMLRFVLVDGVLSLGLWSGLFLACMYYWVQGSSIFSALGVFSLSLMAGALWGVCMWFFLGYLARKHGREK